MITLTENPSDYNLPFPDWYENQRTMVERAANLEQGRVLFIEAPTGCHRAGQLILMWDGSTRPVELIEVGNTLMGPDSRPRYITKLTQGIGQMYQITPIKGSPFVVNENHILTLVRTGKKRPGQRKDCRWGEIVDVKICDYLNWSKTQKHLYKLFRVGVNFPYQHRLEIEPYFLGVLLGDGSMITQIGITTEDQEIAREFYRQAELKGLRVRVGKKPGNKAADYYFAGPGRGRTNYFAYYLENMGLRGTKSGDKFIPRKYCTATKQDRLELLAGLLDTDGHLSANCYDYISKSQQLAEDFAFVARSLGFAAYLSETQKTDQWGHGGTYFRVQLSGNVNSIPCRLSRKQATKRKQKKDALRTGFRCKRLGMEEYFGFILGPSDGRFLLGDFTVTHNSGKSFSPMLVSHFRPGTTVCVATRDLQEQYADSFDDVAIVWGQSHYPCVNKPRVQEFQDAYGYAPTREDCSYRKPEDCPVYDQCPYERSKAIALRSRAKVGNYAYMYYTNWWRGDNVHDLFCDEAHRLPRILSDLISLEVAERTHVYFGLPQFPCISGGTKYAYRQIASWAASGAQSLHPGNQRDPKRRLRMKRMKLKLKSLAESLDSANPGTWYVASGQALGKLIAKPVHPGRYARKILDPDARSITLMSATIGDPGLLAEELGLSQDFEFLTLPHIFPKEHRPVIWMSESPRIRASTTSTEYKHQAAIIAKILNSHRGQRGIIHTVSWKHVKILAGLLSKNGCGSRLYIPEGGHLRLQAIERFKNAKTDLVALTPSWHEGLNFPDDEARFAIVAKVPYLSLGDQVVKLRLHSPGGNKWYRWQAALGVVQSAGRIVRHRDDWGICYIVDAEWSRVSRYAPAWFEVEAA